MSSKKTNFFTNEKGNTLVDQFKKTVSSAKYFDILVGYFRISGFHQLYQELEDVDKIRILIGINIDQKTFELTQQSRQQKLDFNSVTEAINSTSESIVNEITEASDNYNTELSVKKFIEFLQTDCDNPKEDKKKGGNGKKLEIKVYPSQDVHAKIYIMRYKEEFSHISEGTVITGSSNFSEAGLKENREFNVQLNDPNDLEYALKHFEPLWEGGVPASQIFVETLGEKTWFNDKIDPYELYLKMLYEYFEKDINLDKQIKFTAPEGFLDLEYQKQAVISALKILEGYGGLFIADVVGLGKTYIAALLAQQLPHSYKKLVICPPVLKEYWEETFLEFNVACKVESMGKLDKINPDRFDVIFIDEAHRFRNDDTVSFEKLYNIVYGKKVVLVSATPQNNTFKDLFNQLTLFQSKRNSLIPGIPDIDSYFFDIEKQLKFAKKQATSEEYSGLLKQSSRMIRTQILKHVMVRRTRSEIEKYFGEDMKQSNLFFPTLNPPHRIIYELDEHLSTVFNDTLEGIKDLSYARYQPTKYIKKGKRTQYSIQEFDINQQRNLGGFMKTILVKRLESSFFAFKKTIKRFIESYERFIEMYEQGTVLVSKKYNVYDLLEREDLDDIIKNDVYGDDVQTYDTDDFMESFIDFLNHDLKILKSIQTAWRDIDQDPKFEALRKELKKDQNPTDRKIIIFTESKETGNYLFEKINKDYKGKIIFYSSDIKRVSDKNLSQRSAREIIRENFDPTAKERLDNLQILITTDILSEGMNMHRSNTVFNYDLPWNPTKVLQRVGRINRIGTEHETLDIFNFFPMDQSDREINLKDNITRKMQAFHDTLGEDAKYLTDQEELSNHKLFGQNLYEQLNDLDTYENDDENEQSDLEYLQIIRDIRDDDPELFKKVRNIPKKSRVATKHKDDTKLVTFFRSGELKKFFISNENQSEEIDFFQAVRLFEASAKDKSFNTDENYYTLLKSNKDHLYNLSQEQLSKKGSRKGRSNEKEVIKRLKAVKKHPGLTNIEKEFISNILTKYNSGDVPKTITRRLKKEMEKEIEPERIAYIVKQEFEGSFLERKRMTKKEDSSLQKSEVILSKYFIKK